MFLNLPCSVNTHKRKGNVNILKHTILPTNTESTGRFQSSGGSIHPQGLVVQTESLSLYLKGTEENCRGITWDLVYTWKPIPQLIIHFCPASLPLPLFFFFNTLILS